MTAGPITPLPTRPGQSVPSSGEKADDERKTLQQSRSGGTPSHRFLEVTLGGTPTGLKVLVSSDEEIADQLAVICNSVFAGVPVEYLDVIRPGIWPIHSMLPAW